MATGSLESFGRNAGAQERTDTPTLQRRAMEEFLGIGVDEELTHYRLLGISETITNPTVIERAAESRMASLKQYTNNKQYGIVVQELLNMMSRAKITLLDTEAKTNYDAMLTTRRRAEQTLRQRAEPVAPPVEPLIIRQSPMVAPAHSPTFIETLQQHWKVAAGAAVILAGSGVVWFATAGGEKEGAPLAAAKAPKEPESDKATVTKVITTETQSKMNATFAPPVEPAVAIKTTQTARPEASINSSFLAVEPEKTPVVEQPVVQAAPKPEKPNETLVAGAAPPVEKAFDKKEYADNRKALLAAVKDKKGTEQIDEIIATYADNAEVMKDSEMAKAVLVEGFVLATKANDALRSYNLGRRMLDRPDLFEKSETDYATGKLKELAVASNDRMLAFSIFDLLVSKGALSNADGLSLKLTHYKRGPRKTPDQQQATAREMLTMAKGWTDAEPVIAEQFARDAKVMFPSSRDTKKLKDDFDDEVSITLKSIMQAKEFKRANELLAADPTNPEARRVRGEIHMERGNIQEGLSDLAKSNHATLAPLARTTEELQTKGAAAGGTSLLAAADTWKSEAERANGKTASFKMIEASLLRLAASATVEPLHLLAKPQVQKRLKEFGAEVAIDPQTTITKPAESEPTKQPSANEVATPSGPMKEPARPEYVLKEAVWNEKTASWYYFAANPMTYSELAKFAAQHHAMVAAPEDMEENEYIYRLQGKGKNGDVWTGLLKGNDGKLYTPDGKPIQYAHWHNSEGKTQGERHVFQMWGGLHADSYPDVKKAQGVLKWRYVVPNGNERSSTRKRDR